MVPLTTKVRGTFADQLKARLDKWTQTAVGAKITVPDELKFWYWLEFGTAAQGDAGYASGVSYPIDPVNAEALAFPGPGGTIITGHVDHPGIRPRRMVTRVLPDIRRVAGEALHQAFVAGAADAPNVLVDRMTVAVEKAKDLITASIAEQVPGTRSNSEYPAQDGRLQGETAASVFSSNAQVEEVLE